MTHYDKGAYFERQLKDLLEKKGFYVIRAAGSGVAGWTPDLIVLHSTKKFALECKAWKNGLFIDKPTIIAFKEWERLTGMQMYVAWKMPRQEWRFFPLIMMHETERGYSLSPKELEAGMTLQQLTG